MLSWLIDMLGDAAVATILVAALGWLFRHWIAARLTASIGLETDKKLEQFKAQLDAAEARVTAIRDAGINATLQLSGVVVAERVDAVKAVWCGVMDWMRASMVSTTVSALTLEWVRKNAEHPGTRSSMQMLLDSLKHMELLAEMNSLHKHRPFIGERAWTLWSAYHGFYFARVLRAVSLTLDKEFAVRVWTTDAELGIVRDIAPPHVKKAYEANSIAGTQPFLIWLQEEILTELRRSLSGEDHGPDAAKAAAHIAATVNPLWEEAQKKSLQVEVQGGAVGGM